MPGLTERDAAAPGLEALLRWVRPTFAYAANARPTLEIGYFANVVPVAPNLGVAISTDGVGTKLLVAQAAGRFDTVGIDCVAMNVNDILCVGARPVAVVDYVALEEAAPALLDALGRRLARGWPAHSRPRPPHGRRSVQLDPHGACRGVRRRTLARGAADLRPRATSRWDRGRGDVPGVQHGSGLRARGRTGRCRSGVGRARRGGPTGTRSRARRGRPRAHDSLPAPAVGGPGWPIHARLIPGLRRRARSGREPRHAAPCRARARRRRTRRCLGDAGRARGP